MLLTFSKFLEHCILKTKNLIRILSTLLLYVIDILSLLVGLVQYIKHFAKAVEVGTDKSYLRKIEKICFILGKICRKINCSD